MKIFLKFMIIISGLLILLVACHYYFDWKNTQLTKTALKKFTYIPSTNNFKESQPKFYTGKKPFPEAVLVLHGYSTSVSELGHLFPALETNHIPYYAPELTGFGLGDLHLLRVAKPSDWVRNAVNAYDILATLADKVDVIGHSNGSNIAIALAELRPINKLILTGPNFMIGQNDKIKKKLIQTPIIGKLISYAIPVFVKPPRRHHITYSNALDPKDALATFFFPALPTNSLISAWELQDQLTFHDIHANSLYLLYGKYDGAVNIEGAKNILLRNKIPYKSIQYDNSAHNILEDYDSAKVVADIIEILKNENDQLAARKNPNLNHSSMPIAN